MMPAIQGAISGGVRRRGLMGGSLVALLLVSACVEPGEQADGPLAFPVVTSDASPAADAAAPPAPGVSSSDAEASLSATPEDAPVSDLGGYAEREAAKPAGAPRATPSDDEMQVWVVAAQHDDPVFYENYLSAYPNGVFAKRARSRMEAIARREAENQAARDEVRDRLNETVDDRK